MTLQETLNNLINNPNLKIDPKNPQSHAGQPILASILNLPSATTLLDTLPINIDLTLTSPINLNLATTLASDVIAKGMLFANPSLADQAFQNVNPNANPPLDKPGLPVINLLRMPTGPGVGNAQLINLDEAPTTAINGVPGLLGDIQGTVNGPITGNVVSALKGTIGMPMQIPLTVNVQWSVRTGADPASAPIAATDYYFNGDPTLPSVNVILRPETFDLLEGDDPIAPVKRYLHARVSLTAGDITVTKDLTSIEITTLSLGIPRILAMFANQNFNGPCLIMVPERSTLPDVQTFLDQLAPLQAALEALKSFAEFAAFAAGLGSLLTGVIGNPHVKFRKQEGVAKLDDIVLVQNDPITNDMEAEDELSSLLLIGNTGARVQCFNDQNFKDDEGWFEANVRDKLIVMIRNLHEKHPVSLPHADGIEVKKNVPGGFPGPNTFGDAMSSVRFA